MVAFNFSSEFADAVETGRKTQTIRQTARVKPGQAIQLFTGQRTKACRKVGEGVCSSVAPIVLTRGIVRCDDVLLYWPERDGLARADGFTDYDAMWKWFAERYGKDSFEGFVIRWRLNQ